MKIFLGTDHAGFELKEKVKEFLEKENYEVVDCGAHEFDRNDDYPDFVGAAAQEVAQTEGSMGIVFGGSGQGEAMVANKVKGVRCALFYTPAVPPHATDVSGSSSTDPFEMLKLTRMHNNSNVLSLGARFLTEEDALKAIDIFLTSPYNKEERHQRRIDKISKLEK